MFAFDVVRNNTRTAGTTTDNFDELLVSRNNIQNGSGGTLTASGSVFKVRNISSETDGTLNDSVIVLEIVQDTDSTGDAINSIGGGVRIDTGTLLSDPAFAIDSSNGRVGIGEASPEAPLEVNANEGDDFIVLVASANAAHLAAITGSGHRIFMGDAPTLSSCGTSPSVAGNDNAAHVTVGTSESGTCTITFATPWKNKPVCSCDDDSAVQHCRTVETTTTLTVTGTWSDNEEIDFQCVGYR